MDSGTLTPFAGIDIPENVRLGIRLEQIFMPYAHRQRAELLQKQGATASRETAFRFAHYTSAEAALNIINTKRIWMRNTSCMVDYSEVRHGYDLLNQFVTDKDRWGAFTAALHSCAPG